MADIDTSALHFIWKNRVRFAETDAQGVVFYGTYATYQDEATLEYYREIGHSYERVLEGDWEVFIVHLDLDFYASAHFGDELNHGVRVDALGTSSISFEYACERVDDGALMVEGSVVHVVVDEDGEPRPIPDNFVEDVIDYQNVPPTVTSERPS